jgi:hypothetical protein
VNYSQLVAVLEDRIAIAGEVEAVRLGMVVTAIGELQANLRSSHTQNGELEEKLEEARNGSV